MLAFLDEVARKIDAVEHAGERMEELRAESAAAWQAEYEAAGRRTDRRGAPRPRKLEKRVEAELAQRWPWSGRSSEIAVAPRRWSRTGADRVEFLVSPNLGEEPARSRKSLRAARFRASRWRSRPAWRLSREGEQRRRTLVFDEVDAGVGGSAAEGVGRRLKKLAAANQVLCVTHLAQIACFADHHYRVAKSTTARAAPWPALRNWTRRPATREIGRMLSGQKLTPEALKHAEQLIRMSCK